MTSFAIVGQLVQRSQSIVFSWLVIDDNLVTIARWRANNNWSVKKMYETPKCDVALIFPDRAMQCDLAMQQTTAAVWTWVG